MLYVLCIQIVAMCCFAVLVRLSCISWKTATNIIGVLYVILCTGLTILGGVLVVQAWDVCPPYKSYFYATISVSSMVLLVSSCILLKAAYYVRRYAESRTKQRKPPLMYQWVVTARVMGVPLLALGVYGMSTVPLRTPDAESAVEETVVLATFILHTAFLLYFSLVVSIRRRQLKLELDPERRPVLYPDYYHYEPWEWDIEDLHPTIQVHYRDDDQCLVTFDRVGTTAGDVT